MSGFVCPKCGGELTKAERVWHCPAGHCFDEAKSGYVNLLLNQQKKEKRHGDDRLMVRARQRFLDGGYYDLLIEKLCGTVLSVARDGMTLLDVGCGECKYTEAVTEALSEKGIHASALGVDISRDAVDIGAKRCGNIRLAVASAFALPLASASVELILSVFAPMAAEEFLRVLVPGGHLLKVTPRERHLWQLKEHIYDRLYENNMEEEIPAGYRLISRENLMFPVVLPAGSVIMDLFMMTPYFYKTSAKDQAKLKKLTSLTTDAAFEITLLQKM